MNSIAFYKFVGSQKQSRYLIAFFYSLYYTLDMFLDIYGKFNSVKCAVIELNNFCLNNCIHCSSSSSPNSKVSIPMEDYYHIINILHSKKFNRIILSGGEPLLNVNIGNYLDYAKKKDMEIYLYTSGVLCEYDIIGNYLPMISKTIVSLYSLDNKIHDSITRTPGSLEKTLFFIRYLIKHNIVYEINTVLTQLNYKEIIKIINSDVGADAKKINVLKLVIQGNAKLNQKEIEPGKDELNKTLMEIAALSKVKVSHSFNYTNGICDAIDGKICITADGYILPCEAFKGNRHKYPRYSEINLYEYLTKLHNSFHHDCTYALCQNTNKVYTR